MRNFGLRLDQISGHALVADAAAKARVIVDQESNGPGDLDNAMRRIARRYGLAYSALWSLRYRAAKDIAASVYFKIHAAHEAEIERQMRKLEHELEVANATRAHSALVRAAASVAGIEEDGA